MSFEPSPVPQARALRLRNLIDVSGAAPAASNALTWDAVTGRWTAATVATAGIADGAVTYAKLNADVLTGLDPRYVNVTGDTMTGDLTVYRSGAPTTGVVYLNQAGTRYIFNDGTNYVLPLGGLSPGGPLFMQTGQRVDFTADLQDNKINLGGGLYLLGIAANEQKYSVPTAAKHAFRVNAVEKFNVQGATVQALTKFEQSGDYAYLGSFNAGTPTYPRAGNDLAIAWNFGGGNRDVTFWNTDITPPPASFDFRQLTGAGSSVLLLRLGYTSAIPQVLMPDGSSGLPGWSWVADPDSGVRRSGADTLDFVTGANNALYLARIAGVQHTGFFGSIGGVKVAATGSRGGNAALTSLLTALAGYGLITDSSTS